MFGLHVGHMGFSVSCHGPPKQRLRSVGDRAVNDRFISDFRTAQSGPSLATCYRLRKNTSHLCRKSCSTGTPLALPSEKPHDDDSVISPCRTADCFCSFLSVLFFFVFNSDGLQPTSNDRTDRTDELAVMRTEPQSPSHPPGAERLCHRGHGLSKGSPSSSVSPPASRPRTRAASSQKKRSQLSGPKEFNPGTVYTPHKSKGL